MSKIKVTVWSESLPESQPHAVKSYPNDINTAIAEFLKNDPALDVTVSSLSMDECGLSQNLIDNTDVLVWWSHLYHSQLTDEAAERIVTAILQRGMGFLVLHSGLFGKPATMLLGKCSTGGKYRECGERTRVWLTNRAHPIVEGLEEDWFDITYDEMYGEPFNIPTPDDLIFMSWFQGGEVLRSGAVWNRGAGRIFYFQPGHEEFPVYSENKSVQKIITNAVKWLKPTRGPIPVNRGEVDALEPIPDALFPERLERTKGKISQHPEQGSYRL
ncbi:MAG: ThuA domain-containing protein [Oscillospiraceae bacterium]|nr:ThuA domain-containing protein [Oscillospiraceae bacterium]